jgi:Zn-dependent protease with chaperone function
MPSARWVDLLAQSIVHAFVAALAVEALIRHWRVDAPTERLVLRLIALAQPLVVSPALVLGWAGRGAEEFRDSWAIFTARRWEDVRFAWSPSIFDVWLVGLVACGVALFAMDLRPLVRRRPRTALADPPPELRDEVRRIATSLGVRAPSLRFVESPAPALFCTGIRNHSLAVSRGALELLDDEERHAALAHEIAHLSRHDPAKSWFLFALRAVLFYNPVAQLVARNMARDAEVLADELATGRGGADRLALASAIVKLFKATHSAAPALARTLPFAAALADPFDRARTLDVERRCWRLVDGVRSEPMPPIARFRAALLAAGMTALVVVVS